MKNSNTTSLDLDQALKRTIDPENDSQRVTIVSGEKINIEVDVDKLKESIENSLSNLKIESQSTSQSIEIKTIEVPVVVKETQIQIIEVPQVIVQKEIEYKEIKIPYETIKTVEIERPIIIKEIQYKEIATKETQYLRVATVSLLIINLFLMFHK